MVRKILFVCKYNRFRSRVAEGYLKKINSKLEVKSAGLFRGTSLDSNQILLSDNAGINIRGTPSGISSKILAWSDLVIVVADDVPKSIFKKTRFKGELRVWGIKDTKSSNVEGVRKIIKDIKLKVDELNAELR